MQETSLTIGLETMQKKLLSSLSSSFTCYYRMIGLVPGFKLFV